MSNPMHKNIGVIGLGIIGRAVAGNLRRKEFPVFVWNRSPRPVPNFVGSLGELAEMCNYIQIFVSDDEALLQTVEQLSEKLTPRHLVLAHSTVAPDSMCAAAEIVERRGARFVEASFTGSKPAAEKGELVYYVGGTDAALREARTVLEASGKEIVHIGAIGQASAIKIATNMITAASAQAAAEALALVQALGLPLEKFVEAMRANASYSGTLAMKLPKMLERDFEPQFSVKHMLKDMQIASQIALSHYLEEEQGEQAGACEPIIRPAEPKAEKLGPEDAGVADSQQPLLALGGGDSAAAADTPTPLRRGFLKQLLSRLSSGQE